VEAEAVVPAVPQVLSLSYPQVPLTERFNVEVVQVEMVELVVQMVELEEVVDLIMVLLVHKDCG
jgi:hypothetical protein